MDTRAALLKLARMVVQGVIQQINQQKTVIQDTVMKGISQMVEQVVNGIWTGKGATSFINEMQGEVLPQLGELVGIVTRTQSNITTAEEIIQNADREGVGRVNRLSETFRNVF